MVYVLFFMDVPHKVCALDMLQRQCTLCVLYNPKQPPGT